MRGTGSKERPRGMTQRRVGGESLYPRISEIRRLEKVYADLQLDMNVLRAPSGKYPKKPA